MQKKYSVTPSDVLIKTRDGDGDGEVFIYVYNVPPEAFAQAKAEAKAEATAAKARVTELRKALTSLIEEVEEAERYATQKVAEATRNFRG